MTRMIPRRLPLPLAGLLFVGLIACAGDPVGDPVEFTVPPGAGFSQVTDTLVAHELVGHPTAFRILARVRGDDRSIRSGTYRVPSDIGWRALLDQLVAGRVVTVPLTIPEGFTLQQMAARIAELTELDPDSVRARLTAPDAEDDWDVPGPGLEGYLFPDTYHFTPAVTLDSVLRVMVDRYRSLWTPERQARARELDMTEREVMTLASIIQGEARRAEEMPIISGVFHNRLRIGYLLQADPTVQYALGERRSRLLYADIDSVADNPYNTYTQPGLPPGPIGAAGEAALDAALDPADVDYLYFVARPDGSHIFTRTLQEHNRARVEARRLWDELERRRNSDAARDEAGSAGGR
jgi:UPF0755 protein